MSKAKVRATFIPNGISNNNRLRYSIFISIDFSTLDSAPDFNDACAYPAFIGAIKFNLLQNDAPITAEQGKTFSCPEATNLWNLIFNDPSSSNIKLYFKDKPQTFENNFPLDYIPKPLSVIQHFQSHYAYRILSKSGETGFFSQQLAGLKGSIDNTPPEIKQIKELISNIHQNPGSSANTYSARMQQAQEVHVSEIISYFSDYPLILRRLGLLYSYDLEKDAIADGAEIKVQLDTSNAPADTIYDVEIPIPTVVEKQSSFFAAKSNKPQSYINGLLNLQQVVNGIPRFSLVQNSAVEASYKADAYFATAVKDNVPPINTNGIYLIDNFRREQEDDELNSSSVKQRLYLEDILTGFRFDLKMLQPKHGNVSNWRSLNSRASTYQFLPNNQQQGSRQVILEEGWTNTDTKAKTRKKDAAGNDVDVSVVADILCHINSWGLSTNNPLQEAAQKVKSEGKNHKITETGSGDPVHDFLMAKFRVTSKSPKSTLHPLRVGSIYQLRARLVTIDGYSISVNEADQFTDGTKNGQPVLRTSDFKFCRLESVGAPVLVLKRPIYDGNCGAEKKVKEANRGESEYTLVIRSKDNDSKTSETCERGVAPASTSWHLAEWQGAFDTQKVYADTNKLKRSKQFLPQIIEKNGKKYWKERTGKFQTNGDTVRLVPYIVDPLSQCFEILCDDNEIYSLLYCKNPDLNFWEENFDWWNLKTWEIVVKEQRKTQTPGTIRGQGGIFSIDSFNKTVTILIPKGEDLTLKIRSFPAYDCSNGNNLLNYKIVNDHLISNLIATNHLSTFTQTDKTFFEKRKNVFFNTKNNKTVLAREPVLFAEKEFRVIHAVTKPLFSPKFIGDTSVHRTWNPQDITFALLTSTILYPGKTANKLELLATWQDQIDDGENIKAVKYDNIAVAEYSLYGQLEKPVYTPAGSDNHILGEIEDYGQSTGQPITISTNVPVIQFGRLHYCDSQTPLSITIPSPINNKGKFFIFKNRNIGVVTIQSMGNEMIDGAANKLLHKSEKIQLESDGVNWVLRNITAVYIDTEKTFYAKHNFGDTKHRMVEYTLSATSRFTAFFPASENSKTNSDQFSVFSLPITLNIPSSHAPAAPKIAFIVPCFEYEFTENEKRRKGNRLRIYLERPWFSSGEGEKLAVLILNNPSFEEEFETSQAHLRGKYPFVSKWGRDVTTFGSNLLPFRANNFANKISIANNLTINNLLFKKRFVKNANNEIINSIERPFTAIIFDVQLDVERSYWYADVQFEEVHAYCPFIQLSIARYQEQSIADEELSSPILCDYIQVAATRTISYHKNGDYIELNLFGSVHKADFDTITNQPVIMNEVYVAFISAENAQEGDNDVLYISNGDTHQNCDWHKIESNNITILENGVVWTFKGISPYSDYIVLIKEFETFHNNLDMVNPEKNPTRRLTFGHGMKF